MSGNELVAHSDVLLKKMRRIIFTGRFVIPVRGMITVSNAEMAMAAGKDGNNMETSSRGFSLHLGCH